MWGYKWLSRLTKNQRTWERRIASRGLADSADTARSAAVVKKVLDSRMLECGAREGTCLAWMESIRWDTAMQAKLTRAKVWPGYQLESKVRFGVFWVWRRVARFLHEGVHV